MARRKPARPKTQQRHRTKATTGTVARPKRTTDETGTDDVEFFIIAGKRYRWMRSASGAMTAVLAPLEKPGFKHSPGGKLSFQTRKGVTIDLSHVVNTAANEPPTHVEFANADMARAAGAGPSVVKQAAEYDGLVRKAMERTGQTRAEVLAAFNVVEPIR